MPSIAGSMLRGLMTSISLTLVLNVAGPRESKVQGLQASAKAFLEELLWEA